ncbi:MAG TPA: ComF family protein [Hypericibacter adhaerens]|jgi:ComF family protein|uniref:ComF family protein n=1 Tax=Hypericibacter adhaerens TaxID=2602016 RepID=UPI002C338D28|nr:ComF family protein [Hypericibacter adhaerens]HWA43538.1 ComF family protein [Hypericibacter adhaerens]
MVEAAPWTTRAAALGRFALDALLPPRCLVCGATVGTAGALCADCWSRMTVLGPPCCAACGFPFEYGQDTEGDGTLCGACLRERPVYDRARAALRYDDASRGLIIAFKHADRTDAAPALGRWLAQAGAELLRDADLVAPVPLHRWRLFRRRYNQAALLATHAARAGGKRLCVDLLIRQRATPSQGRLGATQRRENVAGAFAVAARHRDAVRGRRVLLVDDVLTTGATAGACARALLAGGAQAVDLLTLARVVRPV